MKKFMANTCESCPLCRYARNNPENWFGKLMDWHGRWCPFWKAWQEKYGKQNATNNSMKNGK
jgi:hypothetical protein